MKKKFLALQLKMSLICQKKHIKHITIVSLNLNRYEMQKIDILTSRSRLVSYRPTNKLKLRTRCHVIIHIVRNIKRSAAAFLFDQKRSCFPPKKNITVLPKLWSATQWRFATKCQEMYFRHKKCFV